PAGDAPARVDPGRRADAAPRREAATRSSPGARPPGQRRAAGPRASPGSVPAGSGAERPRAAPVGESGHRRPRRPFDPALVFAGHDDRGGGGPRSGVSTPAP